MEKSNKIRNDNFITIQGWMVTDLHLKGNALLIYAIIYGFSQAENQVYSGSLQYLADWTNSTKQGVIKVLKKLCEDGLLQKNEKNINGVKFCEYYTTKFNEVLNKVEYPIKQSLTGGIKQSLPNNINIYNIEDNIDIKKERKKERKTTGYDVILDELNDAELKKAMLEFIKMRKLIKKPLTDNALKLSINKLFKLTQNKNEMIEIINQSVMNSWQSFYPLKKENVSKSKSESETINGEKIYTLSNGTKTTNYFVWALDKEENDAIDTEV